MSGEEFSAALWQVRRQMELLLFNLETQRIHLSAGSFRWLQFTTEAIERVVEHLRFETLALNVESAALASLWKGSAKAGLPALIALAPPGIWPELLEGHRLALVRLAEEVSDSWEQNVRALGAMETEEPALLVDATPEGTDETEGLIVLVNAKRALDVLVNSPLLQLGEFLGGAGP
jgi:hypothetical protein